jgi:uncharacterized membrane protein
MVNTDSGRRALDAVEDLVNSLRLAHGAVQRIENELYGPVLNDADNLSQSLHRVRQFAEKLRAEVEQFVIDQPRRETSEAEHRARRAPPPRSGSH